jgi:hypothetical protein
MGLRSEEAPPYRPMNGGQKHGRCGHTHSVRSLKGLFHFAACYVPRNRASFCDRGTPC